MLYKRDVRERVRTAAPFLKFDADPYPVVVNKRILWVIDAYTTSDRYPYSQSIHPSNLPDGSGLDTEFNYVRNSVKATVDAYDGTIKFYVVKGVNDPIIRAYQKAFPELFTSQDKMPDGLKEHWRYPEDVFQRADGTVRGVPHDRSQRLLPQAVHLGHRADGRSAASRPRPRRAQRGSDGGRNTTLAAGNTPIDPLYLTMQLPDSSQQEFVLMRPFVPRGKANQLSAFMAARMDGENYGKLVSYEIPTTLVAPSPAQAGTLVESDPDISSTLSLLDQRGSAVLRGNVQLIPVGKSIIYARPIYVEGQGEGQFPRLRFVALAYGNNAVLVDFAGEGQLRTVDDGIRQLLAQPGGVQPPDQGGNGSTTTTTAPSETTTSVPSETTTTVPLSNNVQTLLTQAAAELAAADQALAAGDLGGYQDHVEQAKKLVDQANQIQAGG